MKLYGASLSPYFERVNLTLIAKGQSDAVELAAIPGGMKSPEHMAANPLGRIPYLEKDTGEIMIESQVIAEYLDATLDGPKMVSSEPEQGAHTLMMCRILDSYMAPAMEHFWANRGYPADAVKAAAENKMPLALDAVEHFATGGDFLSGDSLTLADLTLDSVAIPYEIIRQPARCG